jgi:hypothetical protein
MAKRKKTTKGQTIIYKTLQTKLKTEQHKYHPGCIISYCERASISWTTSDTCRVTFDLFLIYAIQHMHGIFFNKLYYPNKRIRHSSERTGACSALHSNRMLTLKYECNVPNCIKCRTMHHQFVMGLVLLDL